MYKDITKRCAARALAFLGRLSLQRGLPVLTYHSVDPSGSVISISDGGFREHMAYLKQEGYQTLSLSDLAAIRWVGNKRFDKQVIITFDDGFQNIYTEAFPILQEYGFTATIFLVTDRIGQRCDWERDSSIPALPLLTWSQIAELSLYGMEFGSHGRAHPHLTRISDQELQSELADSKQTIEMALGKPVKTFCYPYGDYSKKVKSMAQTCGYAAACTIHFGVSRAESDLHALPRIGTGHLSSLACMEAALYGTFEWYIRARSLVR